MSNLSNSQFRNVYDLSASREIKQRTGVGTGVRLSKPDSAAMIKHENEAMALGNPKVSKMQKVLDTVAKGLGLTEY